MRAVSNAVGGFCFLIKNYEEGLSIFEREAVLDLSVRDTMGRQEIRLERNISNSELPDFYEYVQDPIILVPESVSHHAEGKIPEGKVTNEVTGRIINDFSDLFTSPHPLFDVYINEDDITTWKIIFKGEEGTPYFGHAWLIYIIFGSEYPNKAPNVRFLSSFYHVNVNTDGKICNEILTNAWTYDTTIRTVLENIATMIKFPNPLNALDSVKGSLYMDDRDLYFAKVEEFCSKAKSLEDIQKKM